MGRRVSVATRDELLEVLRPPEHLFPVGSRYDTRFAVAASPSGSTLFCVELWATEAGLVSFK